MPPDPAHLDERLLAPLLRAVDRAAESEMPAEHPDEEMLALFAAGALAGAEREHLVRHLDLCPHCRQAASLLLTLPDEAPPAAGFRTNFWKTRPAGLWLALAATLLLAAGAFLLMPGRDPKTAEGRAYDEAGRALAVGDFDRVRRVVDEAARRGIDSGRLRSLEAQSLRKMPHALALAYAGKLGDFGYEIGGAVARDPSAQSLAHGLKPAGQLLARAGNNDLEVLLNRGHLLLSQGRPREALAEFQAAKRLSPQDSLVWLGQGLAQYMLEDYAAASKSFRECLRLDPDSLPSRINLAMALEEQGEYTDALKAWQAVPMERLSPAEREQVEHAIEELEKRVQE